MRLKCKAVCIGEAEEIPKKQNKQTKNKTKQKPRGDFHDTDFQLSPNPVDKGTLWVRPAGAWLWRQTG